VGFVGCRGWCLCDREAGLSSYPLFKPACLRVPKSDEVLELRPCACALHLCSRVHLLVTCDWRSMDRRGPSFPIPHLLQQQTHTPCTHHTQQHTTHKKVASPASQSPVALLLQGHRGPFVRTPCLASSKQARVQGSVRQESGRTRRLDFREPCS